MAKEIVAWCDSHLSDDEDSRVPGSEVKIAIGDAMPRAIDLCPECFKALVEPLRELIAHEGQPVRPADETKKQRRRPMGRRSVFVEREDGRIDCPDPECGASYQSRSTWRKHLKNVHDLGVNEAEALYGSNISADDPQLPLDELPYACPDCDKRFAAMQGLGSHRARSHGYRSEKKRKELEEAS